MKTLVKKTLEKKIQKRNRISTTQRALLSIVGSAGLLAVGALAPSAIQYIPKNLLDFISNTSDASIYQARRRLVLRGYLVYSKEHKGYILTEKGKKFYEASIETKPKQKWDKKWRVLIFDIAEKNRSARELVRRKLVEFGLVRLQDSVWVYPYPCDKYIELLKVELKLGKNLLYLTVDGFEGEEHLLNFFKLSR